VVMKKRGKNKIHPEGKHHAQRQARLHLQKPGQRHCQSAPLNIDMDRCAHYKHFQCVTARLFVRNQSGPSPSVQLPGLGIIHVLSTFPGSEHRICRVIGKALSTQRLTSSMKTVSAVDLVIG
jgi:hypothetical protein